MGRMGRRRFLVVAAGAAGAAAVPWRSFWADARAVRRSAFAFGAPVSLVVRHDDAKHAELAIDAALAELTLVERLMSVYRADSQLSELNRCGRVSDPHPCFVEVLEQARRISALTGGAFDVTVQPLWRTYAAAAEHGRIPDDAQVAASRSDVDWRRLVVTPREVRFTRPGMQATLNGIAQGYGADRAVAALRQHGIEHALVDAGEFAAIGESERGDAWCVGVQHPRAADEFLALARLDGRALATSGDYATSFSDDRRHHHLFDPRTGRSPDESCSVSILAPTGLLADALSTACFVLGAERSLPLLRTLPDVDALFLRKDGEVIWTAGFPAPQAGRTV